MWSDWREQSIAEPSPPVLAYARQQEWEVDLGIGHMRYRVWESEGFRWLRSLAHNPDMPVIKPIIRRKANNPNAPRIDRHPK